MIPLRDPRPQADRGDTCSLGGVGRHLKSQLLALPIERGQRYKVLGTVMGRGNPRSVQERGCQRPDEPNAVCQNTAPPSTRRSPTLAIVTLLSARMGRGWGGGRGGGHLSVYSQA